MVVLSGVGHWFCVEAAEGDGAVGEEVAGNVEAVKSEVCLRLGWLVG